MWSLRVVVGGVLGQHAAEVPLAEDQHAVGDLGADGQDEALGKAVCPRTARRGLDHVDAGIGPDRVERGRELSGPIADEEPEPGGIVAEVDDEVAGLLRRPRSVGMRGHAQDVQGGGRRPRVRTGRRATAT